mmetsp:Transcript_13473/g.36709  ORF Transcript_13473/g.36709 Transcript_13473/m.36709 type:complete len:320 (+) Transcript_13473:3006-3965(+)
MESQQVKHTSLVQLQNWLSSSSRRSTIRLWATERSRSLKAATRIGSRHPGSPQVRPAIGPAKRMLHGARALGKAACVARVTHTVSVAQRAPWLIPGARAASVAAHGAIAAAVAGTRPHLGRAVMLTDADMGRAAAGETLMARAGEAEAVVDVGEAAMATAPKAALPPGARLGRGARAGVNREVAVERGADGTHMDRQMRPSARATERATAMATWTPAPMGPVTEADTTTAAKATRTENPWVAREVAAEEEEEALMARGEATQQALFDLVPTECREAHGAVDKIPGATKAAAGAKGSADCPAQGDVERLPPPPPPPPLPS